MESSERGPSFYIPLSGETDVVDYVSAIDKLLLTGGQHVLPQFYGQEKLIESDDYFKERDEFELKLVHEALRQEKPILGICRGCSFSMLHVEELSNKR